MTNIVAAMTAGAVESYANNRLDTLAEEKKASMQAERDKIAHDRDMLMEDMRNKNVAQREAQDREWRTSEREASEAAAAKQDATRHSQAIQLAGVKSSGGGSSGGEYVEVEGEGAVTIDTPDATVSVQPVSATQPAEAKGEIRTLPDGRRVNSSNQQVDDRGRVILKNGAPFKINGAWMRYERDSKGGWNPKPVTAGESDRLTKYETLENKGDAFEASYTADTKTIRNGIKSGETNGTFGMFVNNGSKMGDWVSQLSSDGARATFRAVERVNGAMLSQGVAGAKAMGASGINTAAEAEMYFKGMPKVDFSSEDAALRSLNELDAYNREFRNMQRQEVGLPPIDWSKTGKVKATKTSQPKPETKAPQPKASTSASGTDWSSYN